MGATTVGQGPSSHGIACPTSNSVPGPLENPKPPNPG